MPVWLPVLVGCLSCEISGPGWFTPTGVYFWATGTFKMPGAYADTIDTINQPRRGDFNDA